MGIVTSLLTGRPLHAGTPGPTDEFWYHPTGYGANEAGVAVSP